MLGKTNGAQQHSLLLVPLARIKTAQTNQNSRLLTIEGYTPAAPAVPAVRTRNNPNNKQGRQFIVIGFTIFSHTTPLHCAICPLGTLFF